MMNLIFYWVWSVLGILILFVVILMSIFTFKFAKRAYDLVGLIYEEQQEIIGRIVRRTRKVKNPEEETNEENPEEEIKDGNPEVKTQDETEVRTTE